MTDSVRETAVFTAARALLAHSGRDQIWIDPVGDVVGNPVRIARVVLTAALPSLADAVEAMCGVCAATGDTVLHAGCPYRSAASLVREVVTVPAAKES